MSTLLESDVAERARATDEAIGRAAVAVAARCRNNPPGTRAAIAMCCYAAKPGGCRRSQNNGDKRLVQ